MAEIQAERASASGAQGAGLASLMPPVPPPARKDGGCGPWNDAIYAGRLLIDCLAPFFVLLLGSVACGQHWLADWSLICFAVHLHVWCPGTHLDVATGRAFVCLLEPLGSACSHFLPFSRVFRVSCVLVPLAVQSSLLIYPTLRELVSLLCFSCMRLWQLSCSADTSDCEG
eukprot:6162069-Amphidinium_carterae.5